MASTASPPPHSPSSPGFPPSPSTQTFQTLSDNDHCIPPSSASPVLPLSRARSGSRTYSEVQEDERRDRERSRERERHTAQDVLEGRTSGDMLQEGVHDEQRDDGMSINELRAEMETLLSLRRRSMSQPAAVDPDLPPTAPPTSPSPPSAPKRPNLTLTITPPHEVPGGVPISPTAPSPAETGTLVRRKSSASGRLPSEHPLPAVPPVPSPTLPHGPQSPFAPSEAAQSAQDLFWLPASLHPELAPQEFKAFIREQTQPEALARRSSLKVGGANGRGVTRRASLLRGEYKPRRDDGVGEQVPPLPQGAENLKRTASDGGSGRGSRRGSRNTLNFEELTIKDLQRLEELAASAEAEGSGDTASEGERLGRVLRRSLSLNPHRVAAAAAAAGATFGGGAYPPSASGGAPLASTAESDEEAPLLVPPPGQIVRRNARTRIRKGPAGEIVPGGAGGRFGPRRTRSSTSETGVQLTPAGSAYGGASVEDDAVSAGEVSFESAETDEVSADSVTGTVGVLSPAEEVPPEVPSPASSDSQHVQHIEVAGEHLPQPGLVEAVPQVVPGHPSVEELPLPHASDSAPGPPLLAPPAVETPPPQALDDYPQPAPPPPPQHIISPASPDYDYTTHSPQFQQQQAPPPQPPAPVEPQYTVHPGHSPRQPFADVPPPQAVPIPLPGPAEPKQPSPPSSRPESPKPAVKEKKSGWARLGLGSSGKDEKKKGKGKDKERARDKLSSSQGSSHSVRDEDVPSAEQRENDKMHAASSSGGSSGGSGFFGGLFGRKRTDSTSSSHSTSDHPPPPVAAQQAEARMPPPPPTASGALLPNGRYANFYRLPIHVERAVYRLSHIKLANPRRPLYEQVLISNLMFWYLGLIQKPVQPPPAAAPVPIPGMRAAQQQQQQQQGGPVPPQNQPQHQQPKEKRPGLHKPGRAGAGGRAAEMPVRATSFEAQNQQLAEEQQHYHEQRALSQSHPQPSSSSPSSASPSSSSLANWLFAAPLSSSSSNGVAEPKRSPERDRSSAPAQMYPSSAGRTPNNSVEDGAGDDDDRPLAQYSSAGSSTGPQPYRDSYPQHQRPTPVGAAHRPTHDRGFEVTSRSSQRLSSGGSSDGGHGGGHLHPSSPQHSPPHEQQHQLGHQRNPSAVSDKSFDASEIYDAYAPLSPGPSPSQELPLAAAPAQPPVIEPQSPPPPAPPGKEAAAKGKPPLLGTVAPRGSSLKALVGGGAKKQAGVRTR
ncbi:hypothetical protein JCM10213_000968 [Rhodosporidiobolus nylandii]